MTHFSGSYKVQVLRNQKERVQNQKKYWELGGTRIGEIMGEEKVGGGAVTVSI